MNTPILCPVCAFHPADPPGCPQCGFAIDTGGGVLDLRVDKSFDTLLDVGTYDAAHGVFASSPGKAFENYRSLMEECGLPRRGDVLEIACGSGKLTAAMLAEDCFETVHCGDISVDFMRIMSKRVSEIPTRTSIRKYLFDANSLPFQDNAFDYVFGNSVLHHFAEFERTVADAFRVLKPGGAALFGEPIFDSHALVSLAAGLILRSPQASAENGLTARHIGALRTVQTRLGRKIDALNGDRSQLQDIEDKFMFPAKLMRDLGAKIGYDRVVVSGAGPDFDLGRTAKTKITRILDRAGLDTAPLAAFGYIFEALSEDYGRPMRPFMHPVFGHIAFIR